MYFWQFLKQNGEKNEVKKTKVLFVYVDKLKVKTSRNVKRSFYKNLVQNTTHTERKLKTGTKGGILKAFNPSIPKIDEKIHTYLR